MLSSVPCARVAVYLHIVLCSLAVSCLAMPPGMPMAPRSNPFQGPPQIIPPPPPAGNAPPPQYNYVAAPPPQYQPAPPQQFVAPPQQFVPPPQQFVPPPQPVAQPLPQPAPMPVQAPVRQYLPVPVQSNYVQPPPQPRHYINVQPLPPSGNSIYQPMPPAAAMAQAPTTGFGQGGEFESENGNTASSGADFYNPPQMSLLDSYYAPRQGAYQAHARPYRQNRGLFGNLFGGNNILGTAMMAEWMF